MTKKTANKEGSDREIIAINPEYWNAVGCALLLQIPIEFILSILLDGGMLFRISTSAVGGFWVGTLLIILRRPRTPGPSDLSFIRIGYLPLFCIAFALWPLIGSIRGYP